MFNLRHDPLPDRPGTSHRDPAVAGPSQIRVDHFSNARAGPSSFPSSSSSSSSFQPYQPLGSRYKLPSTPFIDLDAHEEPVQAEAAPCPSAAGSSSARPARSAADRAKKVLEKSIKRNGKREGILAGRKIPVREEAKQTISRSWLPSTRSKDRPGGKGKDKTTRFLSKLRNLPLPIDVSRLPALLQIDNQALRETVFKPFEEGGPRSEKHRWLEWQGDAHLNAFITEKLVEDYADISIGQADKLRNYMRSNVIFAQMALHYGFPAQIALLPQKNGEHTIKRLADVFEAYVGSLQKVAKGDHAKEATLAAWLHKVFGARVFPDMEKFLKVIEVEDSSEEEEHTAEDEHGNEIDDDEEEADMELDYDSDPEVVSVIDVE